VLIGLCGAAGSGKDSVADPLVRDHGFVRAAFADALKDIARREFGWDGRKDHRGRRLLQVLGTEAGRAYNPDIWIDKLRTRLAQTREPLIVVPDVRFINEAAMIRASGGYLVRVVGRRGYYEVDWKKPWTWIQILNPRRWHRSEREQHWIRVDTELDNSGGLGDLDGRVKALVVDLENGRPA